MLPRECGLIVQHDIYNMAKPFDGGDSSRSTGVMACFGSWVDRKNVAKHYIGEGLMVRNPFQVKWADYRNFSRDQTIPLVSAMYICRDDKFLREIFWASAKRGFLCQNYDLMTPTLIWQLIYGGGIWWLYWFFPIAFVWHVLEMLWYSCVRPYAEVNQFICQCKCFGTTPIFAKLHPNWQKAIKDYWCEGAGYWRDMQEVSMQVIDNFL